MAPFTSVTASGALSEVLVVIAANTSDKAADRAQPPGLNPARGLSSQAGSGGRRPIVTGTGSDGRFRCEWSPEGFGGAAPTAAARAVAPWPLTHSGSGPSRGSPVKNLAAMHPPRHES